jgi:hypothetical protein
MSGRPTPDARFDEALGSAARALVSEALPPGVLDPGVGAAASGAIGAVRVRRALPVPAALAGAVAVVVLAAVVAFVPGTPGGPAPSASPSASPSPAPTAWPLSPPAAVFRSTGAIEADLATLRYRCIPGRAVASVAPGPEAMVRESAVCTPPDDVGPFMAAVIIGEAADGRVVEVHVKADFSAGDTQAGRQAVAAMVAKASAVVVVSGSGSAVGDWVNATIPSIEPNEARATEIRGVSLTLSRTSDGGYLLIAKRAPTPAATP